MSCPACRHDHDGQCSAWNDAGPCGCWGPPTVVINMAPECTQPTWGERFDNGLRIYLLSLVVGVVLLTLGMHALMLFA